MSAQIRLLSDAKRQVAIDHVITATRRYVMVHGLDVTMDQIADATEVSRRTLFRLFGSREQLIAAAFAASMESYAKELPAYDGDRDAWLRTTCETIHRMNAKVGPGFFELSSRADLPPDLVSTERLRRRRFRGAMARITRVLWSASGGDEEPPDELLAAVGGHLSANFTAALMNDMGQGWQVASELAYDAILSVLRRVAP